MRTINDFNYTHQNEYPCFIRRVNIRVQMFYFLILKRSRDFLHGYICFISILTRPYQLHQLFGQLMLTGCRLVDCFLGSILFSSRRLSNLQRLSVWINERFQIVLLRSIQLLKDEFSVKTFTSVFASLNPFQMSQYFD